MDQKTQATGVTETGKIDPSGATRPSNGVWVLPAARIKALLRGTFLESPAVPGVRSAR
jgi:hypothetical protein